MLLPWLPFCTLCSGLSFSFQFCLLKFLTYLNNTSWIFSFTGGFLQLSLTIKKFTQPLQLFSLSNGYWPLYHTLSAQVQEVGWATSSAQGHYSSTLSLSWVIIHVFPVVSL
jgi:hypothetical protein